MTTPRSRRSSAHFGIAARIAEGAVTFGVAGGRAVRAAPVRRAGRADPLGQRLATLARRRLHVLHGHHDPRRRGERLRAAPGHRRGVPEGTLMASAKTTAPPRPPVPAGARTPVARVHVPARSIRGDLRAVKIVWQRELIRFSKDKLRIVTSLVQPFLFLFVLGTGLSRLAQHRHAWRRPADLRLPGRALHGGPLHGDVLGDLDRLGPRVRLPARDDGRAGAPQRARARQVPRRRDRRQPPGNRGAVPGGGSSASPTPRR